MMDTNPPSLNSDQNPPDEQFRISFGTIFLIAGVIFFIVVIGLQFLRQTATFDRTGLAPDFSLNLYDGGTFTLSEQRGQIVVVNFWGSWCAPCRDEAPEIQAVAERFADDGVIVVGINFRDVEADAQGFLDDFNITFPTGLDNGERIVDRYGITGAPETYIVGRDGNILAFSIGQFEDGWLEQTVSDIVSAES